MNTETKPKNDIIIAGKHIEWTAKMLLGWVCNRGLLLTSEPLAFSAMYLWLLSWAGFYAYDTGFNDYIHRNQGI